MVIKKMNIFEVYHKIIFIFYFILIKIKEILDNLYISINLMGFLVNLFKLKPIYRYMEIYIN